MECADPEGGRGPDHPWKNHKAIGFLAILVRSLKISTKLPSQHLIPGHHWPACKTALKWRFAGGSIMARF